MCASLLMLKQCSKLYLPTVILSACIYIKVETGSGHPGYTLSGLIRFIKFLGLTRIDCTIKEFQSFGAWITQSHTSKI